MPLVARTRSSGGNMAGDLQQRVCHLLDEFDTITEDITHGRNLRRAVVRSQLVCNSVVVLDKCSIFVACERAGGVPSVFFLDHSSAKYSIEQAFEMAVWDFGYGDPFVIHLPRSLLDMGEEHRREAVARMAQEWVNAESQRTIRLSQLVRINPIFGGTDFFPDPRLCFIIMPFDPVLDQIYRDVIRPCVEEQDLVCRRADEIRGNRAIIQDIWRSICEARLVIAELTFRNPNVFYELGIAHTVGKPTILLLQSGEPKFPFDVIHLRKIIYENTAAGGQKLKEDLAATISAVLAPVSSGGST